MTTAQYMTVRDFRKGTASFAGEWIAALDEATGVYTVRCGEVVLCTVNSGKPRRFRSLETVRQALREEMGITEFRVTVADRS